MLTKYLSLPLALLLTVSLAGCPLFDNDDDNTPAENAPTASPISLTVLHINDHHSHITPQSGSLTLGGEETDVEIGGFTKVVSKMDELKAANSNVLTLHAGDAITGTLFYTLFEGKADADMMNQVCFDAFALGNHEFDSGDAGLKKFLDFLKAGSCATPTSVLAANVVPEVGVSPLAQTSATDYIQPYLVKEFNGEKVGIIGLDIADKTKNSSNPDATTQFLDETTTAQKYIDELKADGVNKIILLTHYQYKNDIELAKNLTGVDVIVGGDSHSLLGDHFADLGLNPVGSYPTEQTNKDGDKVCIVQAWEYAAIVGELKVDFDADGKVTSCGGTPHLLLGETFTREETDSNGDKQDVAVTGDKLAAINAQLDKTAGLAVVKDDADTKTALVGYSDQVDTRSKEVIGTAAEDLCYERVPNQGRSKLCDVSDTAANGSDISNIVAKAFLEMSNTSDITIQNGGGVRIDVAKGDISIATAYELLPFANTLVEIEMTGQQIIDVLEEAVTNVIDNGSTGAFPYAAGLRWDLDFSKPAGQRFSNVQVNPRVAGAWTAIDVNKTYKIVTNSFIAAGKDGYLTFGKIADDKKVDTFLDYAQSFVDYVKREKTLNKLPLAEYSTQKFTDKDGNLLSGKLNLTVLHINDHHSHLNPEGGSLTLGGQKTDVEMGGFTKVVTKIKELKQADSNALALHAGDAVTGTLYYTLFKGEADAAMMNQVCFDAFALGNHEFDEGDAGLKKFLDFLKAGSCTTPTPVLAANVVPEVGVSPLAPNSATDYILPYIIKEVNGEKVGIIGIDVAGKTKNSSNPDASTQFLDETTTAQKYIDELKANGVNKVILLTHYQYANDIELAKNLNGVDVIVGGDSHSLLGNNLAKFGLNPVGSYPTEETSKDGNKVCIVQAWQYSAVVGELKVAFDTKGNVESCGGTPHLLLGSTFTREVNDQDVDVDVSSDAALLADINGAAELSIVADDETSKTVLTNYANQVETLSKEVIGTAASDLCLVRFPGEKRSKICQPGDTASNGSDISNIVSKAFLEMSNTSDITIQNAGGVRIDVAQGDITIETAYTLLPFANTLVEINMTGQQIVDVLEEAIANNVDNGGSSGSYPYAAGLRWDLDISKPFGQRFSNVQVNPRVAGTWAAIDLTKTYKVVTNSFIAAGRDGYVTFGNIADDQKVDTFLDYAQSFVDYVKREKTINKLPIEEYSTQKFTDANGVTP